MPITLKSPTFTRKANEDKTVEVFFNSTEPGTVTAAAPGCTFPDGETVVIAGTRTWRNAGWELQHGFNAPAAAAAIMRQRHGATIGIDLNCRRMFRGLELGGAASEQILIARDYVSGQKISWSLFARTLNGNMQLLLTYIPSMDPYVLAGGTCTLYQSSGGVPEKLQISFILPTSGTTVNVRRRIDGGAISAATATLSAAMTGNTSDASCALIRRADRFFYSTSSLSTAQQDLFLNDSMPTDACTVQYDLKEEGTQNAFDLSGNDYDGAYDLDAAIPASSILRIYTDDPGDPVVPASSIRVTIPAGVASPVTLTLTRPRAGVPSRASEAEKTESTTGTITLTTEAETLTIGPDVVCQVPDYPQSFALLIASNYDGACTVVSDNAALVPTSPVTISGGVAVCACTVTADVTGATVTATGPGGDTDACSVTVSEVPEPAELLSIGPDVDLDVESYPASINLLIASNVDGPVSLASDDPNLLVLDSVDVVDGEAEITALALADIAGATITASRPSGATDEAIVSVHDVLTGDWIAAGPNCRTRIEGKRIVWPIRVRSSKDGAFTATADPTTGIIIAGPFVLASGACDITAQPTQAGTWVLTVTQDGRTDSVTLEALAAAAPPTVRQYNLSADIDGFFDFINRKYGFRPRFTPANVQDVRAEHSTDRTFSRYAHGSGQPGSVFGAVALSYQVMISYSSVTMAEQDLGILREEADRYGWDCIGFSMTGQTMFEPIKMMPRLTLTLNFDIIPQGR